MTILSVRDLRRSFGGVAAVRGISFDLGETDVLALIGPNGAGKSTCFNLINGQLAPDSGSIRFLEHELVGMQPRQICRLGVSRTFQIAATYASMTLLENVQMVLIAQHRKTQIMWRRSAELYRDEATAVLLRVGMADQANRICGELAYGDLKRVELAMAFASMPKLLLMDEPMAGMAPKERIALMQLTAEIVREHGISVLFTEHDMDVVFNHADRVIVMHRGELIAEGSPAAVRRDPLVKQVYLGGDDGFARTQGP